MNNWKKRNTPEEATHELMHKLYDEYTVELPKYSWWVKLKGILVISLIVALAALLVIGSLLALPLLIVIGVGFALFKR
jgi:hypothetical protein